MNESFILAPGLVTLGVPTTASIPALKGREETRRGRAGVEVPFTMVVASQGCFNASSVDGVSEIEETGGGTY
jgi:hypothetical protein